MEWIQGKCKPWFVPSIVWDEIDLQLNPRMNI